jgi:hypothetical protein
VLCIRRGVVHKSENEGEVDAKVRAIVSPGVLGPEYFRDVAAVVDAAAGGPPDPAATARSCCATGSPPAPLPVPHTSWWRVEADTAGPPRGGPPLAEKR